MAGTPRERLLTLIGQLLLRLLSLIDPPPARPALSVVAVSDLPRHLETIAMDIGNRKFDRTAGVHFKLLANGATDGPPEASVSTDDGDTTGLTVENLSSSPQPDGTV